MQKALHLFLITTLGIILFACALFPKTDPPTPNAIPRRTVILTGNNEALNKINLQNTTSVGGIVTIKVNQLEPDVTMTGYGAAFRVHSSVLQFRNQTGVWQAIGSGTGTGGNSIFSHSIYNNGTTNWAEGVTTTPHKIFQNISTWTIWGIMAFSDLDREESLYRQTETGAGATVLELKKLASNKLALTMGVTTYSSLTPVFSGRNQGFPMEVGIIGDATQQVIRFVADGTVYQNQTAVFSFPNVSTQQETWTLGQGVQGYLFGLGASRKVLFPANSQHVPNLLTVVQFPEPIFVYDLHEGAGATLDSSVPLPLF
jgi:hypothetical protein